MSRADIDTEIAAPVKTALLAMTPDLEAARTARINGFVEPMGGLGIVPFDTGNYRADGTRQSSAPLTN